LVPTEQKDQNDTVQELQHEILLGRLEIVVAYADIMVGALLRVFRVSSPSQTAIPANRRPEETQANFIASAMPHCGLLRKWHL
jgi:hypothetical protein